MSGISTFIPFRFDDASAKNSGKDSKKNVNDKESDVIQILQLPERVPSLKSCSRRNSESPKPPPRAVSGGIAEPLGKISKNDGKFWSEIVAAFKSRSSEPRRFAASLAAEHDENQQKHGFERLNSNDKEHLSVAVNEPWKSPSWVSISSESSIEPTNISNETIDDENETIFTTRMPVKLVFPSRNGQNLVIKPNQTIFSSESNLSNENDNSSNIPLLTTSLSSVNSNNLTKSSINAPDKNGNLIANTLFCRQENHKETRIFQPSMENQNILDDNLKTEDAPAMNSKVNNFLKVYDEILPILKEWKPNTRYVLGNRERMDFAISNMIEIVQGYHCALGFDNNFESFYQMDSIISKIQLEINEKSKKTMEINAEKIRQQSQRIAELETELKNLKKNPQNLITDSRETSGSSLSSEKQSLELKVDELENDLNVYRGKSDSLEQEIRIITEDNGRLKKKLTEAILRSNNQQQNPDPKTIQHFIEERQKLEGELDKQRIIINKYKKINNEHFVALERIRPERNKLRKDKATLLKQLEEFDNLKIENTNLRKKLDELQLTSVQSPESTKKINELESALTILERELKSKEQEKELSDQEFSKLQEKLKQLEKKVSDLGKRNNEMRSGLNLAYERSKSFKKEKEERDAKLLSDFTFYQQNLKRKDDEIFELKKQLQNFEENQIELAEEKQKVADLQQKVQMYELDLKNSSNLLDELRRKRKDCQEKLKKQKELTKTNEVEIENLKNEMNNREKEVEEQSKAFLETASKFIKERDEKFKIKYNKWICKNQDLKEKNLKLRKENAEKDSKIEMTKVRKRQGENGGESSPPLKKIQRRWLEASPIPKANFHDSRNSIAPDDPVCDASNENSGTENLQSAPSLDGLSESDNQMLQSFFQLYSATNPVYNESKKLIKGFVKLSSDEQNLILEFSKADLLSRGINLTPQLLQKILNFQRNQYGTLPLHLPRNGINPSIVQATGIFPPNLTLSTTQQPRQMLGKNNKDGQNIPVGQTQTSNNQIPSFNMLFQSMKTIKNFNSNK